MVIIYLLKSLNRSLQTALTSLTDNFVLQVGSMIGKILLRGIKTMISIKKLSDLQWLLECCYKYRLSL